MESMMCTVRLVWYFFLFCLYIILPIVGLVWWFVLKSPMEFMFTCIGVALLWTGIGLGYFFFSYGKAKLCGCSSCLCPITSRKKK